MRRITLLGAVAWLALAPAGGAQAQTLEEILAQTYSTNAQLLAQRAALRATDEGVPRALSNWRPVVTLSGEIGKARDLIREDNIPGTFGQNRTPQIATLTVRQPLYRGGRTLAETSRAEHLVQQGRAQLVVTEQSVLLDAVTAYANLLREQATLDLAINNVQVLQRQLDAARDRFQVGEITRTDVSQAEARLAQARANRIQAEGNLTAARANFLRVVGTQPGRLSPPRIIAPLPGTEEEALALAAQNPAVVASRFSERSAHDDVDLIEGEFLPTLNLEGSLARQDEIQTEGLERDIGEIVAVVNVPLYQAGSVAARVREAKHVLGQRRIQTEDTLRRAREDITRTWEALATSRAAITAIQAQIRAAEIALEGVQQEARVGARTVLDVLDAEQELLNARVSLVQSQRDEIVAGYQLAAAVGRLTAQALRLPVEVYDPTVNYNETRGKWWSTGVAADDLPPAQATTPLSPR